MPICFSFMGKSLLRFLVMKKKAHFALWTQIPQYWHWPYKFPHTALFPLYFFSGLFFIISFYYCSLMVAWGFGVGVLYGLLRLGFSVDGVMGLWCGAFWNFFGWDFLYKHKRITLGKKWWIISIARQLTTKQKDCMIEFCLPEPDRRRQLFELRDQICYRP